MSKFMVIVLSVLMLFSMTGFVFAEEGAIKKVMFAGTSAEVWLPDVLALQLTRVQKLWGIETSISSVGNMLLVKTPYANFYIYHTNGGFYKKKMVVGFTFELGIETFYWIHNECLKTRKLMARPVAEEIFFKYIESFEGLEEEKDDDDADYSAHPIDRSIITEGEVINIRHGDTLIPVLLPQEIPSWIGDSRRLPQIYAVSKWLKLLVYSPWMFAVFNDRGELRVIAIASYENQPPVICWKHGLKNGKFALEPISEMEYLGLLAKYHGKEE